MDGVQSHQGPAGGGVYRGLLEEVLKKLPNHDLEGRLSCSLERAPCFGGFSDIYIGAFKDEEAPDTESTCSRCKSVWDGDLRLAVKTIRVHMQGVNHRKNIARELYVFSKLLHPNVLPFTGFLIHDGFPAIVTPWMEKGSLYDQIHTNRASFDRSKRFVTRMACGIADGLAYLHEKDILHCDLKSHNILLSATDIPLLADFGLSRIISGNASIVISHSGRGPSTVRWSAPELYDDKPQCLKETDVWAFGMVLYELISHKLPYFEQTTDLQVMRKVTLGMHPNWPPEEGDVVLLNSRAQSALRELCEECWSKSPNDRPTMQFLGAQLSAITFDPPDPKPEENNGHRHQIGAALKVKEIISTTPPTINQVKPVSTDLCTLSLPTQGVNSANSSSDGACDKKTLEQDEVPEGDLYDDDDKLSSGSLTPTNRSLDTSAASGVLALAVNDSWKGVGKADTGVFVGVENMSASKFASPALGRMKDIDASVQNATSKEVNGDDIAKIDVCEQRLKESDAFVREFARDIVGWAACVKKSIEHLRAWALRFARTIGISDETPSEAFSAFLDILDKRLTFLCNELVDVVGKELLPQLVKLLDTSKLPARLLHTMHSLENPHFALLSMRNSKTRPPPAMLESSQNYFALRSQLNAELPAYLKLLDAGIVRCIQGLVRRQAEFWVSMRDHWATLWECLRMEGETNAGCEETVRLWWDRYSEVNETIANLSLLRKDRVTNMSQIVSLPSLPTLPSSRPSSTHHRSFGSMDAVPSPHMYDILQRSPPTESFLTTSLRNKSRTRTPENMARQSEKSNTAPLSVSSSSQTSYTYTNTSYLHGQHSREHHDRGETRNMGDLQGRKSFNSKVSRRLSESLREPLERSPSYMSIESTAHGRLDAEVSAPPVPPTHADWPARYTVVVVHPFETREVLYRAHPFFRLQLHEIYDVLDDAGHPSKCEGLPLHVDDEADSLLLVRNEHGKIGWALASFLFPISYL